MPVVGLNVAAPAIAATEVPIVVTFGVAVALPMRLLGMMKTATFPEAFVVTGTDTVVADRDVL